MESLRRGTSPELYHFTTTCHKLATQFVTICNDQINHYTLLHSISFIEKGRKQKSSLKAQLNLVFPSMHCNEGSILLLALFSISLCTAIDYLVPYCHFHLVYFDSWWMPPTTPIALVLPNSFQMAGVHLVLHEIIGDKSTFLSGISSTTS